MRTLLRGLGAIFGLAAALVGLPMLLLWIPQGSLAQLLPHTSELPDLILGNPLDPGVILLALIAVGWICWAQLLVSFIIEVVYEIRGVQVPNLGRWMPQTSVARAVSAITMMAATLMPTTPSHAAPPPMAAVTQQATPTAGQGIEAGAAAVWMPHAEQPTKGRSAPRYRVYEVQEGDCLWDIADRELGDPERWPEIHRASTKRIQPDGQQLTDPDILLPGWRLNVPIMHAKHQGEDTPTADPKPKGTQPEPSKAAQPQPDDSQSTPNRTTPDREPAMATPAGGSGGVATLPTTPAHLPNQSSRPGTPFHQATESDQKLPEYSLVRPSTQLPQLPDWLSGVGR